MRLPDRRAHADKQSKDAESLSLTKQVGRRARLSDLSRLRTEDPAALPREDRPSKKKKIRCGTEKSSRGAEPSDLRAPVSMLSKPFISFLPSSSVLSPSLCERVGMQVARSDWSAARRGPLCCGLAFFP